MCLALLSRECLYFRSVDNRRVVLQDRVVSIFSALRCSEVMCNDQTRTHSMSKPIRGQGRLKQDLCNYIPYCNLQPKIGYEL